MKNQGFIKEILIIAIAILILNYFGISTQEAADWVKKIFNYFINLFN